LSEETINWFWDPKGLSEGEYTLKPIVSVNGDNFHTSQRNVEIEWLSTFLPILIK